MESRSYYSTMMKILYIGNKLSSFGKTPTSVETLGVQFEEFANVITASDKRNPVLRFVDMCSSVFKCKDSEFVIIDTYSTSAFYYAFAVSLCCRLCQKKYIPILRGGSLPSRLDRSKVLSKALFSHSYVNVSPSGYLRHEFSVRGYDNLVVIPNNINIKDYNFKKRTKLSAKILWVRSFSVIYNPRMAVDVLSRLLKVYPTAELCMVGPDKDGSMQDTLDYAKSLGVAEHLKVTGTLSRKQWHELSEQYDVFINTTNFDNTPVSVIEAMALGLPVVSTNVGGLPYLLEDGKDALLVDPGNAEEMYNKIVLLLNDPMFVEKICFSAREKAESFDWNVVSKQWKDILK